jgi:hypothetical protein
MGNVLCASGYSVEADILRAGEGTWEGREEIRSVAANKSDIWHVAAKEGRLSMLLDLLAFARSTSSKLCSLPEDRREKKILSMCDKAGRKGLTPLHLACMYGHAECVRFFVMLVSHTLFGSHPCEPCMAKYPCCYPDRGARVPMPTHASQIF